MMDAWAKRRAAVAAEVEAEAATQALVERAEVEAAQAEQTDEELLAEFDLPDPDGLEEGDDFSVFMAQAVPARLKQRALRRLWRLNPVLANVDGLVDYGEDFTDAATVVENLQTAYQVGKGMLKHVEELARQAEAIAEAEGVDKGTDVEDAPIDADAENTELALAENELAVDADDAPDTDTPIEEPQIAAPLDHELVDVAPARARRMSFTFDQEARA